MLTGDQQIELTICVATAMKSLTELVGVTDLAVALLCVEDAIVELGELEKFVKGCKTEEPTP